MGKAESISFSEREAIEKLLLDIPGISNAEIARRLRRSKNGINCEFIRAGGRNGYKAQHAQDCCRRSARTRYVAIRKVLSEEQKEAAQALFKRGYSIFTVAGKLKLSYGAVARFLIETADQNKKTPEGQQLSDLESLHIRVEALEQQLEIILDLYKELVNETKN